MQNEEEQTAWKESLTLWANVVGLIGGISMLIGVVTFLTGVPGPVLIVIWSVALAFLFIGILARVFLVSDHTSESIGKHLRDSTPQNLGRSLSASQGLQAVNISAVDIEKQKARIKELEEQNTALEAVRKERDKLSQKLEQTSLQLNTLEKPKPEPNLRLTSLAYESARFQDDIIRRGGTNGVLIAKIGNDPLEERMVSPVEQVQAQITFYDVDNGNACVRVDHGCWLEEKFNHVPFGVGAVRWLIVALKSGEQFYGLNNNHESQERFNRPNFVKLEKDRYRVEIKLVGGEYGEVVQRIKFDLTLNPPFQFIFVDSVDKTKQYEWLHEMADAEAENIGASVEVEKIVPTLNLSQTVPSVLFRFYVRNNSVFEISIDDKTIEGHIVFCRTPLAGQMIVRQMTGDIPPYNVRHLHQGVLTLELRLSPEEVKEISDRQIEANFYFEQLTINIEGGDQFRKQVKRKPLTLPFGIHKDGGPPRHP